MESSTFFFHNRKFIFRNPHVLIEEFHAETSSIYFSETEQEWVSLSGSPFGSFIIQNEIDEREIKKLVQDVIFRAKQKNIRSITVKCYPEIYSPQYSKQIQELVQHIGFGIKHEDISQVISLQQPLTLTSLRKRMITRCLKNNFRFQFVDKKFLALAYPLFIQTREAKNFPITMNLKELMDAFDHFGEQYLLPAIFDGEKMIAAVVVIKINAQILYYFFPGHDLSYNDFSPLTFLIERLSHWAKEQGFMLLDLGTSTDKGKMNHGLYQFKKSFGAFDSKKTTFQLLL